MSVGANPTDRVINTEGRHLPSVYLSYPYSRPHFDAFTRSIAYASAKQGVYGDLWLDSIYGFSLDLARNALRDRFLESGQDFWMCVDSDALFKAEAIERLISHNLPMVCGCMYTRTLPPRPTIGRYVGQSKGGKHIYGYAGVAKDILQKAKEHGITDETATNDMLFPKTAGDLVEVDGCGFHFVLLRRDLVEKVKAPAFMFMGSTTAGEDYYFCRKVKDLGYPIYLDLSVQTGHIDSEDANYGIKELLYLTKYIPMDALVNVGNWEMGA